MGAIKRAALKKSVQANRRDEAAAKAPALAIAGAKSPLDAVLRSEVAIRDIPLHLLAPDPDQPRKDFPEEEIEARAESLRENGQLMELIVWRDEDAGVYRIVEGECRFRAAPRAGLETLRCRVLPGRPTAGELRVIQLVTSIQRKSLNAIEEAEGMAQAMRENGWTAAQLCKALGLKAAKVSKRLALLELHPEVIAAVREGDLAHSVAYKLKPLDHAAQVELASRAMESDWGEAEVEGEVDTLLGRERRPLPNQAPLPFEPPPKVSGGNPGGPPTSTDAPVAGVSGGNSAAPRWGSELGPEWHRPAEFVVTLDDGAEVRVEYDGEPRGTCGGSFSLHGPINEAGSFEHIPNSYQIRPGMVPLSYAEDYARREADYFRRRTEERARRERHDAARAEIQARHDRGVIAGWDGPSPWYAGEGEDYDYFEGDAEDFDSEGSAIELRLHGRGYDAAIACVEKALLGLRFRKALSEIRPLGARPGDRVEMLDAGDQFAGRAGEVLDEPGRFVTVRFPGSEGLDECEVEVRGDQLRRIPWPVEAEDGGGD